MVCERSVSSSGHIRHFLVFSNFKTLRFAFVSVKNFLWNTYLYSFKEIPVIMKVFENPC